MKNILEEMYNGNIYPCEQIPYTAKMKEATGYVARHKETLLAKLDDAGKETLEKLIDNFYEYCSLLERETFHYAIKLGANLIIELTKKGDTDE